MASTQLTPEQRSVYEAATNVAPRQTTPATNADPNNPENLPIYDRITKTIAVLQTPAGQTPEYQAKADALAQRIRHTMTQRGREFVGSSTADTAVQLQNMARFISDSPARNKTLIELENTQSLPSYGHRQPGPSWLEKFGYLFSGQRNKDAFAMKGTKYNY